MEDQKIPWKTLRDAHKNMINAYGDPSWESNTDSVDATTGCTETYDPALHAAKKEFEDALQALLDHMSAHNGEDT
jgi:hypothetical protein